jgi:alpha-tubulin suppressor-like RCC1 family protein
MEGKGVAESLLLYILRRDYGDHVFKFLASRDAGRLECTFTSELVFVPAGGGLALLRSVAGRRHVEAAKAGATLVPLGDRRGGRKITCATERLLVCVAMGRARVGAAKQLISAGESHSLVTSGKEGQTWSFGDNSYGKLGRGSEATEANEVVPRLIEALSRAVVRQVAAGADHSMVLTRDAGEVWTWGSGRSGRLGHGNTESQRLPKLVEGVAPGGSGGQALGGAPLDHHWARVISIAAGYDHSLAVREQGTVYAWGSSEYGQLGRGGHGAGTRRLVPTEVPASGMVVAVTTGCYHSLALSRDGTVMACGRNAGGQLGLGDTVQRDTFTVVAGLRGVVDIGAGHEHSIAVTMEGEVFTCGKGRAIGHGEDDWAAEEAAAAGVVGLDGVMIPGIPVCKLVPTKVIGGGIEEATIVQVISGVRHSMALTATGDLYAWGEGGSGQLGREWRTVGGSHGWRRNLAVPKVVDGIKGGVVGMAAGKAHSLVTTEEGRVLAFGSGESGKLGLGAVLPPMEISGLVNLPTAIGGITMGEEEDGKEGKE